MAQTSIILKHFKLSEFDSPDQMGSGKNMQVGFLLQLDSAREIAKMPFVVTSGYRTQAWHDYLTERGLPTAKNSPHLVGCAADIAYKNLFELDKIVEAAYKSGIFQIGIGKNFVHLDNRNRKPTIWFYANTPAYAIQKYRNFFASI